MGDRDPKGMRFMHKSVTSSLIREEYHGIGSDVDYVITHEEKEPDYQ